MKMKKGFFQRLAVFLLLTALLLPLFFIKKINAEEALQGQENNRFNVVIATDASNSINYTDPERLRDDAVEQFIGLLAEKGNTLGGVVFSTKVEEAADISEILDSETKKVYTDFFKGADTYNYTNIGAALDRSVNMIQTQGKQGLPSVIVLLSDGNTEMPDEAQQTESLTLKADAIQRARDAGIKIYTICLNANNKADVTEMQQISQATGGSFAEVKSAEDLKTVFNEFYDLIYGTATIQMIDDVFPEGGQMELGFSVPGIGVEEVNIIVSGASTGIQLYKPDGTECGNDQMTVNSAETFSMVKLKNVEPGDWKIVIQGNPGNQIKVNMLYNTNLVVDVTGPSTGEAFLNEKAVISAQLKAGDITADKREQYMGYEGILEILDDEENVVDSKSMELSDSGFSTDYLFKKGVYYYRVRVKGNYLEKESKLMGPLSVTGENTKEEKKKTETNTPPVPVENRVKNVVYKWPFKDAYIKIPMKGLATDKEDKNLKYKVVSSSFLEGTDYTVDKDIITQEKFSLSHGSYTVRAMDSGGLTCEIEVEVHYRNVGVMALIGIGIIAVIVLIVMGILLYIALTKPFGGAIYVQGYINGKYSDKVKKEKRRGRCKLSMFGLPVTGLNYSKCYFQATGEPHILLISKTPVFYAGQATRQVRIENGAETTISIDQEGNNRIYIQFDSRLRNRRRSMSGRGSAARGSMSFKGAAGRPTGTPKRPGAGRRPERKH